MSRNFRIWNLCRSDSAVCWFYWLTHWALFPVFVVFCELLVSVATLSLRIIWVMGWCWFFQRGFALTSASCLWAPPTKNHFHFLPKIFLVSQVAWIQTASLCEIQLLVTDFQERFPLTRFPSVLCFYFSFAEGVAFWSPNLRMDQAFSPVSWILCICRGASPISRVQQESSGQKPTLLLDNLPRFLLLVCFWSLKNPFICTSPGMCIQLLYFKFYPACQLLQLRRSSRYLAEKYILLHHSPVG